MARRTGQTVADFGGRGKTVANLGKLEGGGGGGRG